MMQKICVLIPSYNEARTIGPIVKRLAERGFTVYVVDDGSVDDTAQKAKSEGAVVVKNEKNMGKGTALRAGFKRVLADGHDAVLVMDGDDQHDVGDIAHLIKKMRETDAGMVIGNRMLDTSSMPLTRIVVNRFMSYVLSEIAGQYVPDTQCGFRLIKREALEKMRLASSKYEIESEMIIEAGKAGFKIESVPVRTVYQNQRSRINPIFDSLRFIAFLVAVAFKKR